MYIYKVVKGEKAAVDLLTRMNALPDGHLHWCESFAHAGNGTTGDITVERIYAKSPQSEYHELYCILYMQVRDLKPGQRGSCMMSNIRDWVYEDIRSGRITQ